MQPLCLLGGCPCCTALRLRGCRRDELERCEGRIELDVRRRHAKAQLTLVCTNERLPLALRQAGHVVGHQLLTHALKRAVLVVAVSEARLVDPPLVRPVLSRGRQQQHAQELHVALSEPAEVVPVDLEHMPVARGQRS